MLTTFGRAIGTNMWDKGDAQLKILAETLVLFQSGGGQILLSTLQLVPLPLGFLDLSTALLSIL